MSILNRKIRYAVFFLLTVVSVFAFFSCAGKSISADVTVRYLTAEDYLSGDYEGKLKESIEIGTEQKLYVVIDVKLSKLSKLGEDSVGTLSIKVPSDKITVEEIPTTEYSVGESNVNATFKLKDGDKDERNLRFIVSALWNTDGSVSIYATLGSVGSGIGIKGNSTAVGYVTVDGGLAVSSKLSYELSSDGTYYTVVGLGEEKGDRIVIPEKYEGLPVKEIADNVFSDVGYLKSVTLPDSLEKIGRDAFKGCNLLKEIVIPKGVTAIGDNAFAGCTAMHLCCETGEKPEGWSESSISEVKDVTWSYNKHLVFELRQDESSYRITSGKGAVGVVNIPKKYKGLPVLEISESAFQGCTELTEVHIPDSVAVVGRALFYGCKNLVCVTLPDGITEIKEIMFKDCVELKNVNVPNSVLKIEESAFKNCSKLAAITLSKKLEVIEKSAFYECAGLTNVVLPSSIRQIGEMAFYKCSKISAVNIPYGVRIVEKGAFYKCDELTELTLPDSVTSIKEYAFFECKKLLALSIPSGVNSIGESAFEGCNLITSLTVPKSVTSIGNRAFVSCSDIASLTLENGIKTIGESAFGGCAITELTVPDSVTSLGSYAFSGCVGLESAVIGSGVRTIKTGLFLGCKNLTQVDASNGVSKIEPNVFSGCTALSLVRLGGSSVTWYRTENSNYTGGYVVNNAFSATSNAGLLRDTYKDYYWYKK